MNSSAYDPSRKTVGGIYLDAQKNAYAGETVVNGDLTNSLMSSLAEDLNNTIESDPYEGSEFYITVHEKKDLMMPKAILRRLITTKYRPYPEDDTVVFRVDPKSNAVRYCWCLPHHTAMDNMLINEHLYHKDLIKEIKAWKDVDLRMFGFMNLEGNKWIPDPNHQDIPLKRPNPVSKEA